MPIEVPTTVAELESVVANLNENFGSNQQSNAAELLGFHDALVAQYPHLLTQLQKFLASVAEAKVIAIGVPEPEVVQSLSVTFADPAVEQENIDDAAADELDSAIDDALASAFAGTYVTDQAEASDNEKAAIDEDSVYSSDESNEEEVEVLEDDEELDDDDSVAISPEDESEQTAPVSTVVSSDVETKTADMPVDAKAIATPVLFGSLQAHVEAEKSAEVAVETKEQVTTTSPSLSPTLTA